MDRASLLMKLHESGVHSWGILVGHAAGGAVAHAYSDAESIESMAQSRLDASGAANTRTWLRIRCEGSCPGSVAVFTQSTGLNGAENSWLRPLRKYREPGSIEF